MLAIINQASKIFTPTKQITGSHVYSFWTLRKPVTFHSSLPFSRGDVVEVEKQTDELFKVFPKPIESLSISEQKSLGFLLPMCTQVPMVNQVDYSFWVDAGKADILSSLKITNLGRTHYVLVVNCKTKYVHITGRDSVYGDEVEFIANNKEEFRNFLNRIA